jgi:hypothetical protein
VITVFLWQQTMPEQPAISQVRPAENVAEASAGMRERIHIAGEIIDNCVLVKN